MKYIILTLSTILLLTLNGNEFYLIQPIAVEEAPPIVIVPDLDGDGVLSDIDKCPNTQKGLKVGVDGCKIKSFIVLLKGKKENSSIVVATQRGTVTVDKPNQFVSISSKNTSPTQPKDISEKELNTLFADVVSSTQQKQLSYILYFNGIKLTGESKVTLQTMLNEISTRDKPYIKIIGHTDTAGSSEKNNILGLKRATVVENIIKDSDASYVKIQSESYSESNLAIKTEDETVEQLNRRVEVFVH